MRFAAHIDSLSRGPRTSGLTLLVLSFAILCVSILAGSTEAVASSRMAHLSAAESAVFPEDAPKLERVSFSERVDGEGLVVRLHVSGFVLDHSKPTYGEDGAFEVTLFRTRLGRKRLLENPIGPVKSYRVDELKGNVTIKLDFGDQHVRASAYRDRNSDDILISLSAESIGENSIIAAVRASRNAARVREVKDAKRWTIDTIIIDAGHGGKDFGAVGSRGEREKDIVLDVALKLGEYLERELDVDVLYTRDDDRFISLEGRGHFANQSGGKLFISIHANSARDRRARGTETFFLGLHKSDAAKRVMDRENEVIQFEENASVYDAFGATGNVVRALAQSAYMRQSEGLAEAIEDQFEDRAGRDSRGVKQAGFYVLYGASMPAVLVELGFITNPAESRFMKSRDGQAYLASAIFRAVRDYKTKYDQGL